MAGIELRVGRPDDWPAVARLLAYAFHHPIDPEVERVDGAVWEPRRALVAVDGTTVVAHAAAFTRELTVPGALLPAAHVSLVGVLPSHRRRGLLTAMMQRQLREINAAGVEPIAVLWASEGSIYPRYGYGLAAQRLILAVPGQLVRPAAADRDGRLRLVDPAAARPVMAQIYERLRAGRTGWSSRDERWWSFLLADPAGRREGGTELRAVVHEGADGPTGYALWRARSRWTSGSADGEVEVQEVLATDPSAYTVLWRFLLSVDLTSTTRYALAGVDEPLLHLVDEPRRLAAHLADSLWLRLVDAPRALAARRYAASVDVVVELADAVLPANAGRWRLVGGPGGATCTPTGSPADLTMSVLDLGSAYLGGTSLSALAAAGRVRELREGTLRTAAVAFGWERLPAASEMF